MTFHLSDVSEITAKRGRQWLARLRGLDLSRSPPTRIRLQWALTCSELTCVLHIELGKVMLLERQVHSRQQHEGIVPEGG